MSQKCGATVTAPKGWFPPDHRCDRRMGHKGKHRCSQPIYSTTWRGAWECGHRWRRTKAPVERSQP